MSSIKIIAVPFGFAPLHIREQWVGIQIPLATKDELQNSPLSGIKIGNENSAGHIVLRKKAIEALREAGKDEAAEFWSRAPIISIASYLQFQREVCEITA